MLCHRVFLKGKLSLQVVESRLKISPMLRKDWQLLRPKVVQAQRLIPLQSRIGILRFSILIVHAIMIGVEFVSTE